MTAAYVVAAYLLGALSVCLLLGAVIALADEQETQQPVAEPEPLYVPRSWFA